jgi:hypothetical protein
MDGCLRSFLAITGALDLTRGTKAINETRKDFIDYLNKYNPDLQAARDAWAGPSQSMDAIRQGQNFMQMPPEQIQDQIAQMTFRSQCI